MHLSLTELIETVGYVGMFAIVFLESGIPFGFFLPGDTLLFTAGLLASQGFLSIVPLIVIVVIAAIAGDSVGYWIGAYFGPKLFTKEDVLFLNKKHLERTEAFYAKYGAKAVILARFIPVVRTFVPILAGVGSMRYSTFIRYNIIGGVLWGVGVPLAGYYLGTVIPDVDKYLIPIVLAISFVSILPIIREVMKKQ